jgi:hypothetical protein
VSSPCPAAPRQHAAGPSVHLTASCTLVGWCTTRPRPVRLLLTSTPVDPAYTSRLAAPQQAGGLHVLPPSGYSSPAHRRNQCPPRGQLHLSRLADPASLPRPAAPRQQAGGPSVHLAASCTLASWRTPRPRPVRLLLASTPADLPSTSRPAAPQQAGGLRVLAPSGCSLAAHWRTPCPPHSVLLLSRLADSASFLARRWT